jgi:hypothetical protein
MGTIREAIKAQAELEDTGIPWYFKVAPIIPLVVVKALGYGWYSLMGNLAFFLGLFVILIALVVFILRRAPRITCPMCGAPLGLYAYAMEDGPQHKGIDSCPTCGVNLDERIPESTESNEADGLTGRVRLLRGTDEL